MAIDVASVNLIGFMTRQHHQLPPEEWGFLLRACQFAVFYHDGQLRGTGDPYHVHPLAVEALLYSWGFDYETRAAGLLHDTVEDCLRTRRELEQFFSYKTAAIVWGVTKVEGDESATLRRIFDTAREFHETIFLKMADTLDYLATIYGKSPESRRKKLQYIRAKFLPLCRECAAFVPDDRTALFGEIISEIEKRVEVRMCETAALLASARAHDQN